MMTFKEFVEQEDVKPIKPGTYRLYRGSHDKNQNAALGIYFNGIHYTTDITTALEFGDVEEFYVTLQNPKVFTRATLPHINPTQHTQRLIDQGYDSAVILHNKSYTRYERDPDSPELLEIPDVYTEYEVIKLAKI